MPSLQSNHSFALDYASAAAQLGRQTPSGDILFDVLLESRSTWPQKYVSVDLKGTKVAADIHTMPKLNIDEHLHKGVFTQSILVKVWLSTEDSTWLPNVLAPSEVAPDIQRYSDVPSTTGEAETFTRSTTESVSANVGTMAGEPMAGISAGVSSTQGVVASYKHFNVSNASTATAVSQLFYLRSTDAGPYVDGHSLFHRNKLKIEMAEPPTEALANLDIPTKATFSAPGNYTKSVKLNVAVEHTLVDVEAHFDIIHPKRSHVDVKNMVFRKEQSVDVDFSKV